MKRRPRHRPPKTRVVCYWFVGPFTFDIYARLERAEREGVITTWDDGRGDIPWFQGPPGPKLRELKREFVAGGGLPFGRPFTHPDQREHRAQGEAF